MEIGIGLPTTVPGGTDVVNWSRAAEEGPFASVGVLDRVAYRSLDPFLALAAAAAVTSRVRVVTMVAVGPVRSTALLAKQAASVDQVSGGRLVLGLALGARLEDYEYAGADARNRAARFSEQLAALRDHFEDADVCPPPAQDGGPPLLVGGLAGPALWRMARFADGYVHGGGPPRAFARAASDAAAAWVDAERPGRPQLWGQGYFGLGDDDVVDRGAAYLRDYYAFTGPFAEKIAAGNLTTPGAVRDFVRGYEDAGCDHLILLPTVADADQIVRLAEVVAP
ncbi:MAG TPA: LLM class flavin-dependent oxidoreductase [Actinomycetota bacterium]|jgi:alkanesulfonate monooxygenase SsuD/methylene tetrahydromethanopterin reductase-like flavin-dependent oxidoreductase (luciferase family)